MADPKHDSKVRTILSELRDVNKDRRRTAGMKLGWSARHRGNR